MYKTSSAQPPPRGDHTAVSILTTVPVNLEKCGYAGIWGTQWKVPEAGGSSVKQKAEARAGQNWVFR